MELNERIAQARKDAGLTQEQLGELVGVTRQAVSKWESGQTTPDVLTIGKLCQVLGVSADYLLLGKVPDSGTDEKEWEMPELCPACGRLLGGTLCPSCGYQVSAKSDTGQRYAILATTGMTNDSDSFLRPYLRELTRYCGMSWDYANMILDQMIHQNARMILKRDMLHDGAVWVAAHLDHNYFKMTIVEDRGEAEEDLLLKPPAMDLPVPAPAPPDENKSLGFWGVVGAVIVALILLSLF